MNFIFGQDMANRPHAARGPGKSIKWMLGVPTYEWYKRSRRKWREAQKYRNNYVHTHRIMYFELHVIPLEQKYDIVSSINSILMH